MRLKIPLLAVALGLIPSAGADFYNFEGQGVLRVSSADGRTLRGCIASNAEWSDGNACGGILANGGGLVRSEHGLIGLNHSVIAIIYQGATTWQATSYNELVSLPRDFFPMHRPTGISQAQPQFIVANEGNQEYGGGGPFWYAARAPTGTESVALSANSSEGAQNVTLTWIRVL
ncbi:hypothetical protein BO94DRAFT_540364 [Aspergillus sclerotioniger CBS 115572]|uniref:Uncharacterized protein n=1 Tax=Aspergillus sclerotioniger CBS 115572 TaxID=1450535 RepID=A0A317V172_9EURO|nr:hypothetical protein BO94DRAFT_540364 [Aspergillus sclerotioniger CBS 115572]PWY68023.1 hypothetical protein BO94DRAFT_540364 [Aspergillus sclerotioniger CBS 115572]